MLGEALAITGGGEVFPLFGRWLLSRLYCGIKTPLSLRERATLTLTDGSSQSQALYQIGAKLAATDRTIYSLQLTAYSVQYRV